MEKISLSKSSRMEWQYKDGVIPYSEDLICSECDSERLAYKQVNVEKVDGEFMMNAIFECSDCGEDLGTQITINKRRFSYFRMKFDGEIANGEQIRELV